MPQPTILLMSYPNDGRKLKRLIIGVLKQDLAKCIQRLNYVKSYYLREGEIKKDEEKIVLFKTTDDKKEKLTAFLKKMHPYEVPELVWIDPTDIDDDYAKRLVGDDQPDTPQT